MAATLTSSGELTYASFGIEKVETTEDGDLLVYGKATDATLDHDQQVIDTTFSSKAMADWMASGGNLRVQHNPQRDPAGIGVEIHTDESGATFVKALVVEPIAKKLVSKGVLRAYSVGIANPTIERDVTGKARGGIIKGGKIVELSLVDRPANPSCGVQLVKSAIGGSPEVSGELFGDNEAIAKAINATMMKAGPAVDEAVNNIDQFETPYEMGVDFNPNDLMRILSEKTALNKIVALEKEILGKDHREFSADRRRELASGGNALPDGSYPIPDKDALRRAAILARSGHGNVAGARRLIARRAKELGVANPLDSDDKEKLLTGEDTIVKVDPDHDGDNDSTAAGDTDHDYWTASGKQKKPLPKSAVPESCGDDCEENCDGAHSIPKPTEGVAMPSGKPSKPNGQVTGSGKEATPDVIKDPAKKPAKKPKKGKKLPPWLNQDDAEKCHTPPDQAAGVPGHDMEAAPVGELMETPAPDHMKTAAILRFKTIGIDSDLGMLHDLTCPAFHPDEVAKYYPGDSVVTAVDPDLWQRKALAAATGKSIAEAMEAQQVWQAAVTLKGADVADLTNYLTEMHKAFRDANPGPTSGLTPGHISPQKYNRPVITDGHSANGSGYGSPNSAPNVATGQPNAHHFDKPPMSAGHQSPSPSFMKGDMEYPSETGVPTRLDYAIMEKEKSRRALSMMHDHLTHMFPSACPMLDQDAYRQEQSIAVPATQGLGKAETEAGEEVLTDVYKFIRKLEKKVRLGEITEAEARNRLSKRTATKYAESLKKQVKKGLTSRDEVLKALGIDLPKPAEPVEKTVEPVVQKAVSVPDTGSLTPDLMKSMMTEIMKPFEERIELQNKHIEEQSTLLTQYQEKFDSQAKELEEHRARWDALANNPDPASGAFANLALNPLRKPARPVDVQKSADERVHGAMMRQLERQWRTSENPAEREAAYAALQKYKGSD